MICCNCKGSGFKTTAVLFRHQDYCLSRAWKEIVDLRLAGDADAADRKARRILGVVEPMTEEAKEKLKTYYEEHKEEILAKAKLKRMTNKKLKERLNSGSKEIKRKKL